ncbi:EF-hand domain-containing protein [Profundibacter sp.]
MKTTYWIAGLLVVGLGAGVVTMAGAHQGGHQNGSGRISFEMLDTDGDGRLTEAEMKAQKSVQFSKTDTNGDGLLSTDEMLARGKERVGERMAKRISHMIERRDANSDGMLSLGEMENMPRGKNLFKRLDTDGDGAISAEEFAARKIGRWGRQGGKMTTE